MLFEKCKNVLTQMKNILFMGIILVLVMSGEQRRLSAEEKMHFISSLVKYLVKSCPPMVYE